MYRLIGIALASALLAGSPVMAGGSMERPTDAKAPETNKDNTDTPASVGKGSTEPMGQGQQNDQASDDRASSAAPESKKPSGTMDQAR